MTKKALRQLKAGTKIHWSDPDGGTCSKDITIATVTINGDVVTVIGVSRINGNGSYVELECLASELTLVKLPL